MTKYTFDFLLHSYVHPVLVTTKAESDIEACENVYRYAEGVFPYKYVPQSMRMTKKEPA